jgi:hypothetical protein
MGLTCCFIGFFGFAGRFALMGIEATTTTTADPYGMTNKERQRQKRRATAEAATEADLPPFGEGQKEQRQKRCSDDRRFVMGEK